MVTMGLQGSAILWLGIAQGGNAAEVVMRGTLPISKQVITLGNWHAAEVVMHGAPPISRQVITLGN